jgi:hypothetical protein
VDDPPEPVSATTAADQVRLSPDEVRRRAAEVVSQSERLRDRLAETAAQVAVVEEHAAKVHDLIAEQRGPGSDASESARQARQVAAVERRMARAYRAGQRPAETFNELLRDRPPQ